jgi:hypothetical protein
MKPPFTIDEFFGVFAEYNQSIWPMQLVLLGAAITSIILVYSRARYSSSFVTGILAFLWAWAGVVYHLAHFTVINKAAGIFGLLFLIQAGLLAWCSRPRCMRYAKPEGVRFGVGWVLIAYALVIYPVLNKILGHDFLSSPTFGSPCPTTIYTIGLLYLARPLPKYLLVIPIAWAIIGSSAAFFLGVPQDLGLLVAGAAGVALLFARGGGYPRG